MGLFDTYGKILGIDKSGDAIAAQEAAASHAADVQKQIYDQQRQDMQPWREAGVNALGGMQNQDFQKDFTLSDFNKDPGYQFRMDEGQKALERSAAAKGGLMGGATLKGIADYGQNFASNEYQNAYNRFNNDRNQRFGRLSTISNMGLGGQSQMNQAAQNYGNNVSNIDTGLGNATAAAKIASGNSVSNLLQQGTTAAMMFSDERLKIDIEPVSKEDIAELRACIKPHRFKYINDEHGKGEFIGVLAQDLQKSKLGKTLVHEDESGFLKVDFGKAIQLLLATQAEA